MTLSTDKPMIEDYMDAAGNVRYLKLASWPAAT